MEDQKEDDGAVENKEQNYELKAPDGGWGYVVMAAMVVVISVTIIPMAAFGLIYGNFLRTIGDETTGTTLSNGIFTTINSFTGLLTNGLLSRYSHRKVGILGSVIFVLGASANIFSQNFLQLILFFGIIQGVGIGFLLPTVMSAFNSYFDKRINLMMSVAQALITAFNMAVPHLAAWSMKTFGFRNTLVALAILGSLSIPAVATFQPVKRHMKKVYIEKVKNTVIPMEILNRPKKSLPSDILQAQIEPLMNQEKHITSSQKSLHSYHSRPRKSIVSLGDRVASVTTINEIQNECYEEKKIVEAEVKKLSFWQSFAKSMDMSLLRDAKYLNISIGLALCFLGDVVFISIIPMMLGNIGFSAQQTAVMMAVFFGSDLVSRIMLAFVSYVVSFRNRLLVLFASVFIVVARTAFVSKDDYTWRLIFLGILGFLRCFIQTPLPLVLAEEYPDRFSTAFSLFMAVSGAVSLIIGPLMGFVKSYTQSDVMVCHLLTLAYIICVISWTSELTFCRKKIRNKEEK